LPSHPALPSRLPVSAEEPKTRMCSDSTSSAESPIPRPAARILLLDHSNRVLLFRTCLPHRRDHSLWITPGGGLKPAETYEEAALRELREETGLESAKPGPCVWTRRHVWQWGNVWYDNQEKFFFLRTPRFKVVPLNPDTIHGEPQLDYKWWSLQEIEAARDVEFAPRDLAEHLQPIVAGHLPATAIDVGP